MTTSFVELPPSHSRFLAESCSAVMTIGPVMSGIHWKGSVSVFWLATRTESVALEWVSMEWLFVLVVGIAHSEFVVFSWHSRIVLLIASLGLGIDNRLLHLRLTFVGGYYFFFVANFDCAWHLIWFNLLLTCKCVEHGNGRFCRSLLVNHSTLYKLWYHPFLLWLSSDVYLSYYSLLAHTFLAFCSVFLSGSVYTGKLLFFLQNSTLHI